MSSGFGRSGLFSTPPPGSVVLGLSAYATDSGRSLVPAKHDRVTRVVALSGGYTRVNACKRLSANHGMIASFSRALAEDLKRSMSDAEFNAALARSIDEIYQASAVKV